MSTSARRPVVESEQRTGVDGRDAGRVARLLGLARDQPAVDGPPEEGFALPPERTRRRLVRSRVGRRRRCRAALFPSDLWPTKSWGQ